MARTSRDDLDLEPEFEQSSETPDGEQEHLPSQAEELDQAAESEGLSIVADDTDDLQEELEAIEEASDPEADRLGDEALEGHDVAAADAAVGATAGEGGGRAAASPDEGLAPGPD